MLTLFLLFQVYGKDLQDAQREMKQTCSLSGTRNDDETAASPPTAHSYHVNQPGQMTPATQQIDDKVPCSVDEVRVRVC